MRARRDALSLDYAFELRSGAKITPRLAVSHIDAQFSSLFQNGNYFRIDEHDLTHLSVTFEKTKWLLQAYCNNCGNKVYVSSVGLGGDTVVYGDPRTTGVRFNVKF